jgi:hypothetical protein
MFAPLMIRILGTRTYGNRAKIRIRRRVCSGSQPAVIAGVSRQVCNH